MKGRIIVSTEEGDGFVQQLLRGLDLKSEIDVTVGWSARDGIYFSSGTGFEFSIPVNQSVGPATIRSIFLSVSFNSQLNLAFGASVSVRLGPITVGVDRIGAIASVSSSENGNLGLVQVDHLRFLAPIGATLTVSGNAITGGGVLHYDRDIQRYAGALQLQFDEINLSATGLITTAPGEFSMLVSICTVFNPPIQLAFGFILMGVGGLIGVHRTMDIDTLREGLRKRTLDSIMYPQDVIGNADKIIGDLESVFPREQGRFIIGPMVKIAWGTPPIIQADIALVLELPAPIRVVILGQLEAKLPTADDALIEIHLDVMGVIDVTNKTLAIDATLYDSRILEFALSGDAALRLSWGDNPQFALSLGGFHPKFTPPPNFPALRRLSLSLGSGGALQISSQAYFALTPNSLQFGVQANLFAKAGKASIQGYIGFDTLIYFSPFSFVAEINAGMVVKVSGRTLAGIRVHMLLSGPTPWHAEGKAKIEILFFEITVRFSLTWGREAQAVLTAGDPWGKLLEALGQKDSLRAVLPGKMTETLQSIDESLPLDTIIVHPAGILEVCEKILPLGRLLDKFGNAPITGSNTFSIDGVKIGQGQDPQAFASFSGSQVRPLQEYFARAQFEDIPNDAKLSVPSFELMQGGIALGVDDYVSSNDLDQTEVCYEIILYNQDDLAVPKDEDGAKRRGMVPWHLGERQLLSNAASQSGLRTTGNDRYAIRGAKPKVTIAEELYAVVRKSNLRPASSTELDHKPAPSGRTSRSAKRAKKRRAPLPNTRTNQPVLLSALSRRSAEDALRQHRALRPEQADDLQIVSMFEAAK